MATGVSQQQGDFVRLLTEISKKLRPRDFRSLKYLCLDLMGYQTWLELGNSARLLNQLVNMKYIQPVNLTFLAELLYTVGRYDLLKTLGCDWKSVQQAIKDGGFNKLSDYRLLLYSICEDLDSEEFAILKRRCSRLFPSRDLHNKEIMEDVLRILETDKVISPIDLRVLRDMLRSVNRSDLIDSIRIYEETCRGPHKGGSFCKRSLEAEERYKMSSQPTGKCMIVNNEEFWPDPNNPNCKTLSKREGSFHDEENLMKTFERLGFEVELRRNLTDKQLEQFMQYSASLDHSRYDCFVCCILSHGAVGEVYGSNSRTIPIQSLTSCFNSRQCPTLNGKPKLFFIQACQGLGRDQGSLYEIDGPAANAGPVGLDYHATLPQEADFLLSFATVAGYVSYRSKGKGSWFIQSLTSTLENYADREDLLSILIRVNNRISKEYADIEKGIYKQIPAPTVTLRKKVYFSIRK